MNNKRVLTFPEKSIGRVYASPLPLPKDYGDWELRGEARGIRKVPEGYYVRLNVGEENPQSALDFLTTLNDGDIQTLKFFGGVYNNESLSYFQHLTTLNELIFLATKIDKINQFNWSVFEQLETLIFVLGYFGCEGLEAIKCLTNLKVLSLEGTNITDDCLPFLFELEKLKELSLKLSKITDNGLSVLSQLSTVEVLDISLNRITNQSLNVLRNAIHLKELYVEETFVNEAGVEELQEHLPNCKINLLFR